jgi:DNA-binding NarL/FixJ family response regulator
MRLAFCCKEGLFGESLSCLLDHHGNYQVVASEDNARSLVKSAKDQHAHILVVDSEGLDTHDLQFLLGAKAFGDFAVVLIVDDHDRQKMSDSPVDRVVPRSSSSDKLFEALNELGGFVNLSVRPYVREGRRSYAKSANELSAREYECAQLVSKGMSNRKISQITGLREQSVKNLVSVVMRKLGCENRVQVALRLTNSMPREVPAEATPPESPK